MTKSNAPTIVSLPAFLEQQTAQEYCIVEPFFPEGGICYLHGRSGLGKSFVANAFMRAVADGTPFLGKFATKQGRVLYLEADMTPATQRERLRKAATVLHCPDNVFVMPWEGSFDIEHELKAQAAWIEELRAINAALIIVDTVRKTHRKEENSNDWPAIYYALWKEIVGASSLLFVAHDNKDAPQDTRSDKDRARGGSAWIDDSDAAIRLTKREKKLWLKWSKVRTVAEDEMTPVQICVDDDTQMAVVDEHDIAIQQMFDAHRYESNGEIAKRLQGLTGLGHSTLMRKLSRLRPKGVSAIPVSHVG